MSGARKARMLTKISVGKALKEEESSFGEVGNIGMRVSAISSQFL